MSDAFWIALFASLASVVPVLAVQFVQLYKTKREIEKQTALRDEEIDLIRTGAFRKGHVAGMEKAHESQPGGLTGG